MDREEVEQHQIDLYVLGGMPREEALALEARAILDVDLRDRIDEGRMTLEDIAWATSVEPSGKVREQVLTAMGSAVNEEDRLHRPPVLHRTSTAGDFKFWIEKPEHALPLDTEDFHLVELDTAEDRQTGLVWLKEGYPEEVHTDCVERLMILEGTCNVHIGNTVAALVPGGVIAIPMHVPHHLVVTSAGWCKAIVQRVAA